jgi:hypothetical protein
MTAPWSPMVAPPLPLRNDAEWNTCEHAYPAESCLGDGSHLTMAEQRLVARTRRSDVALAR